MYSSNELNQPFIACRLFIEVETLPALSVAYSLDKNLTVYQLINMSFKKITIQGILSFLYMLNWIWVVFLKQGAEMLCWVRISCHLWLYIISTFFIQHGKWNTQAFRRWLSQPSLIRSVLFPNIPILIDRIIMWIDVDSWYWCRLLFRHTYKFLYPFLFNMWRTGLEVVGLYFLPFLHRPCVFLSAFPRAK